MEVLVVLVGIATEIGRPVEQVRGPEAWRDSFLCWLLLLLLLLFSPLVRTDHRVFIAGTFRRSRQNQTK